MSRSRNLALFALVVAVAAGGAIADAATRYNFGRPPTPQEIRAWDIDVNGRTGAGLPPGSGSVKQGEKLYVAKCSACHGDFGEGNGRMPELAGGRGTLTAERPLKTVGSYWPYAPTLFDYIRRAMPFPAPESLTNDEVYAVTAYILNLNDLLPKTATLDAKTLAAIRMPNRDGFIPDDRPDTHNTACMRNCKPAKIVVTSDLAKRLQVTPTDENGKATTAAPAASAATAAHVSFAQVQPVIAERCAVCHAQKPTQAGFTSAPAGLMLDTPARIKAAAAAIKQQAVTSRSMPLGNLTHMTDAERALVGRWIDEGAPTS